MKTIAKIYNDYCDKFGIPRQSGLVKNISKIIFEKPYRVKDAINGLEQFSHIWLLWRFSETELNNWQPTVRPPQLGGNKRIGVFATRSPYRPNPIALSCVKILKIDTTSPLSPVIYVEGADILNGTEIYDIKPYIPYADCITDASSGFSSNPREHSYAVIFNNTTTIEEATLARIKEILEQNPRPAYHDDDREYKMNYSNYTIKFKVSENTVTVTEIIKNK